MVSKTYPTVSTPRISSVVPGTMTAENTTHPLAPMDLAMKLHYVKALYVFDKEAVENISVHEMKDAMFPLLDVYYPVAGRIRVAEGGCRVVKCNDTGVRIAEAVTDIAVEEWVDDGVWDERFVYGHAVGPEVAYSPFVYIQLTRFKCGGLSVGLSWAHILGDCFSASNFINKWAQIISGYKPIQPQPTLVCSNKNKLPPPIHENIPSSLRRVETIEGYWLPKNDRKMKTHSVEVTSHQIDQLLAKIGGLDNVQQFDALAALIWKSLARIRGESYPKVVTLCTIEVEGREKMILGNRQLVSTVQADFNVAKVEIPELVKLIKEGADESGAIEEFVERDNAKSDFVVYGGNLTFVNLEGVNVHGLELKGKKPFKANYSFGGVGDEGVILVYPMARDEEGEGGGARTITFTLPDDQVVELKKELEAEWGTF